MRAAMPVNLPQTVEEAIDAIRENVKARKRPHPGSQTNREAWAGRKRKTFQQRGDVRCRRAHGRGQRTALMDFLAKTLPRFAVYQTRSASVD